MFASLYRHDGWNVGLLQGGRAALLDGGVPAIDWLRIDGRRGFAADPFLIEERGTLYCFFEAFPYASNRGKICYVAVDAAAERLLVHDAIVEPHHLSYPYLIRHEGEIVCVPEAYASGRVTAYAARNFPGSWYVKHTLIDDFAGVDNTIFEHDGRWWMLNTDGRSAPNSDLHLWYADSLFGEWRPHRENPVKRDLAGSRPGGQPFTIEGRLYRPAQDCTIRYGRRLVINEILELSVTRFVERPVSIVEPDAAGPYPAGLHTASVAGDVVAVDGNRVHFVPRQAIHAARAGVQKVLRRLSANTARH
jgi:hypothetical protein